MESILTSIKKLLGIAEDYTHFDADIIIHINSALTILHQLGIGPTAGYFITGSTEEWSDFLPEGSKLEAVKTYIYLKVKMVFDPSASSVITEAMKQTINELEWRLIIAAEEASRETEEDS